MGIAITFVLFLYKAVVIYFFKEMKVYTNT
jgi:hypothetical protein